MCETEGKKVFLKKVFARSFPEKTLSWNFLCEKQFIFPEFEDNLSFKFRGFFFFGETEWKLFVCFEEWWKFFLPRCFFSLKKHAKNFFQEKHFLGENQVENFFCFLLHAKESFHFHWVKTKWRIWVWIFFLEKIF